MMSTCRASPPNSQGLDVVCVCYFLVSLDWFPPLTIQSSLILYLFSSNILCFPRTTVSLLSSCLMPPQNAQQPASKALVTGVVVFYLVAALSMVMANKWVLNSIDAPLFFLLAQLVIAVLLFLISGAMGVLPDRLTFETDICRGLIPMVALNVVGLSFSNYTLKFVDASFYQVARGLVLPFTVGTSFIVLHSRPSLLILVSCSIVTLGFFVGVFLDGTPISVVGVGFGVASSAITAVHSVVIKKSLDVVKGSALLLSWYTNLLSALVLAPLVMLAGELPAILSLLYGLNETLADGQGLSPLHKFLWGSAITGALGFMMSFASLLSIKITSPITHMVSSAVRGVAGSLLGKWYFGDVITSGRVSSIAIILGGSMYYTWIKHVESQPLKSDPAYERVKMEDIESAVQKDSKPE